MKVTKVSWAFQENFASCSSFSPFVAKRAVILRKTAASRHSRYTDPRNREAVAPNQINDLVLFHNC
jgi:hypothetical protein